MVLLRYLGANWI